MTAAILILILMSPIYLGWLFCLGAPFLALPLFFGGAILNQLFSFFGALKMSRARAKRVRDYRYDGIVIGDDGSPLVDFSRHFPSLPLRVGKSRLWGRFAVGEKLVAAQAVLPVGYRLLVTECFRSNAKQAKMQSASIREMKANRTFFSERSVDGENDRMDSEFQHSGKKTGGAFDVTLVDGLGVEIEMGDRNVIEIGWFGNKIEPLIDRKVRANRKMLSDALGSVGFAGFPMEWWHWSYGDRHWSSAMSSRTAIYGDVAN